MKWMTRKGGNADPLGNADILDAQVVMSYMCWLAGRRCTPRLTACRFVFEDAQVFQCYARRRA